MKLHVFKDKHELIRSFATFFIQMATEAIVVRGRFTVALSGGSSPRKVYELLSSEFGQRIDWNKVYFFFSDERYVPKSDMQSNFRMADESLLQPLRIVPDHIFPVDTSLVPEEAATDYQIRIERLLGTPATFDLVLLGLGDNAHTASLFPFTDILTDDAPAVRSVYLQEQDVFRVTFNAPLINNAKQIAFLVFGKDKAAAVQHVLSDELNTDLYPAQLIRKENTDWFIDEASMNP